MMETNAQTPDSETQNSPTDCPKEAKDDHSDASSSGIFSQEDLSSLAQQAQVEQDYQANLQQSLANFTKDDDELKGTADPSGDISEKVLSKSNVVGASASDRTYHRERSELSDEISTTESEESSLSSNAEEQLKKPLQESLSDVARFAYCSLVAVCLPNLFENQWNKQWNLKTVKTLAKHMGLPKQSENTLALMVEDPNHHDPANIDVYRGALQDDPTLIKPYLISKDMIMRALQDGAYDARMRVLVREVSQRLGVRWRKVVRYEKEIVDIYQQEEHELTEEEKKEREKKAKIRKAKRIAMIGAATIGGGAIIGLTGGLAAPLIATAGAALFGTSLGLGFFGTVAGAAVLGSILGAAGAGLSGYKMKKRVGAVEEFEFTSLTEGKDLHVTIAISGWLTKDRLDNFTAPWQCLAGCNEIYCLKWESKHLLSLGEAIEYILESVMTMAAKEALKYTVLSGLLAAIALPAAAYAAISSSIDNPWSIATSRASEAGKQLAEVLLSRQQGKRPVTLIGFSMGARVIFFCLKELSTRKGCEGLIQDVYLLGAPVTSVVSSWRPFGKVVAGQIVNGYCRGDWLLQFVYRTASMQVSDIAGLEPIRWKDRRMVNVDLTEIVNGHLDYSDKMDAILDHVGLETREKQSSSYLSELLDMKERESLAKRSPEEGEGDGGGVFRIDASDLLIPKSASAVDLALAKQQEGMAKAGRNQQMDPTQQHKSDSKNASLTNTALLKETCGATGGGNTTHAQPSQTGDRPPSGSMVDIAEDGGDEGAAGRGEETQSRGTIVKRESIEVGEDPLQGLMG